MNKGAWTLVMLGGLVVIATPASAGDCYARPRTYYQSYYPSYSYYTPTYYAPTYTPCEVKVKTQAYPMSPDYYSSVNDYYRDKLLIDALAGKTAEVLKTQQAEAEKTRELKELREEVNLLRQRLLYSQPQLEQVPPRQPPPRQEQPPPRKEEPPPKKEEPKQPPKKVSILHPVPAKLAPIVQGKCIRCHGESFADKGGGLDFRNLDSVPGETRRAMAQAVEDGTMPMGGKNLSDEEYQEFRAYATGRRATVAQK